MSEDNIRLEMRTTLGKELKKDGEYLFDFLFRNLDCTEKDIMKFVDDDIMDNEKYQSLKRFYILHIRGVCALRNLAPDEEPKILATFITVDNATHEPLEETQ